MSEEVRQLLANLHLRRIADIYDEEMKSAEEDGTSTKPSHACPAQYHYRRRARRLAHPACQPAQN
jgi:hypothetical protein